MAGAFVAVADDATAAYWNPADLATGSFLSLLLDSQRTETWMDRTDPFTPATSDASLFTGLSIHSVAMSYYRLRTNQIDQFQNLEAAGASKVQGGTAMVRSLVITRHAAFTRAQPLWVGANVGATIRYIRGTIGLDPGDAALAMGKLLDQVYDLDRQGKNDWDLDFGLTLGSPEIRGGLVARNLRQPIFSGPEGGSIQLKRQVRAGLAVRSVGGLLVATDIDLNRAMTVHGDRRSVAVGAENRLGEWFTARGGARFDVEGKNSRPVGAVCFSVAPSSGLYLDAQMTRGRDSVERGWDFAGRMGC